MFFKCWKFLSHKLLLSLWLSVSSWDWEFPDFVHSFMHFFAQQIFIKHLLCAGHCARRWGYTSGQSYNKVCNLPGSDQWHEKDKQRGEDVGREAAIGAGGQ